ncbi:MAG: low molecular weight phosphatase family protein, partial [Armatimonadota bacterium]
HGPAAGWRRTTMTTVLFVCVHNAGRSQMAEAYVNALARAHNLPWRALSAGTVGGSTLNPTVVEAMAEVGIPLTGHHPKVLDQAMVDAADRIITMGWGVDADQCPARIHLSEDWGLEDPKGRPLEAVRGIRDSIRARVAALLDIPA